MAPFQEIYVVIDQRDKTRVLAIFDNIDAATQYGREENGHVYPRKLRTKVPDQNSRYKGYIT